MKRILTLDGGGIRGLFSLQILKRIEQEFREESGEPDLVLRDVFDFFAGTSTGAIIATYLAWGKSVEEIETLYGENAKKMFTRAPFYRRWKSKFDAKNIAKFFKEQFREKEGHDALLGTRKFYASDAAKLPTYLLIVMRDATTGSSWSVCNNPKDKYCLRTNPECNLDIPLWQLLRASTAAPTFFPPQEIELNQVPHTFMDGGITPYNNPSLTAVLMATLPPYEINWETGVDKIHLVSVGTGHSRVCLPPKKAKRINLLDLIKYVIPALMHTVGKEQDKICRVLGHCVYDGKEAREDHATPGGGGDFDEKTRLLTPSEKKFTYVRYNHEFTEAERAEAKLTIRKKLSWAGRIIDTIFKNKTNEAVTLDNVNLKDFFKDTGFAYAAKAVKREHLFPPKA